MLNDNDLLKTYGAEIHIIDRNVRKKCFNLCGPEETVSHCGKIYIALKFSPDQIDRTAHDNKIWGDLLEHNIRYQFNRHMADCF